jgi:hypothetical protein
VSHLRCRGLLGAAILMVAAGCSSGAGPASANKSAPPPPVTEPDDPDPTFAADALPSFEEQLPEVVRASLTEPYTGDLDGMVKRRLIRVGVSYNRTN